MFRFRSGLIPALVLSLVSVASQPAFSQGMHIINAASFGNEGEVSPDMIIAVFGANLTASTASTPSGAALPTILGGTTLTINGAAALLLYVSPGQVNAIVAHNTPLGGGNAVLTSPTGTFITSVTVDNATNLGIFSLEATGTHNGAIVNAMTSGTVAFSPTTSGSPTFLALFVTGFDVTQTPTVMLGGITATVQYFGPAPGFTGLEQINVQLPPSLAGSGRVEVVVKQGSTVSNVVEIVLLPRKTDDPFRNADENREHSRELSAIASIPGTSLVLVADENDDVVRVVDLASRNVKQVIDLPEGAEPVAVAVSADGKVAVVAERSRASIAIIDLTTFMVKFEAAVGQGPRAAAISGSQAVVVNQDSDSVSFIDTSTGAKIASDLNIGGRAPRGVAIDASGRAWVTVQNAGIVVPIDLGTHTALTPLSLGATARPGTIQAITSLGLLVIAEPGTSATGKVFFINPATSASVSVDVNPDGSGGAGDLVVSGSSVFFANQTGGSVTMVPVSVLPGGAILAPPTSIKADMGVRSLTIDTKDNLLVAASEGTGNLVLIDLNSLTVTGRVNAIRSNDSHDDGNDDHSDRDSATNAPVITSLTPEVSTVGAYFTLTVTGKNLQNASALIFYFNWVTPEGRGAGFTQLKDPMPDSTIAVTNLTSTSSTITANISIPSTHKPGTECAVVVTPNGTSNICALFNIKPAVTTK